MMIRERVKFFVFFFGQIFVLDVVHWGRDMATADLRICQEQPQIGWGCRRVAWMALALQVEGEGKHGRFSLPYHQGNVMPGALSNTLTNMNAFTASGS